MSASWVRAWLRSSAAVVHERSAWLTELDAAIGDGDHGINLERGFALLVARLGLEEPDGLGEAPDLPADVLLREAGRVLLGSVGGASGALYGRALQRASAALADGWAEGAAVVDVGRAGAAPADPGRETAMVARALDAAVEGIAALGRSGPGDKTMLDALAPAALSLRASAAAGLDPGVALDLAADVAEQGARATIPLVARRGRASYLGERSAGHLDPGAASSALLIRALASSLHRG